MKCKFCGTEIPEGSDFCFDCKAGIREMMTPEKVVHDDYDTESPVYTDFFGAIRLFFTNWLDFDGRSTRSEFWFALLFVIIVTAVTLGLDILLKTTLLSSLWQFIAFIPMISLTFRRLHDGGASGNWCALMLLMDVAYRVYYYCDENWLIDTNNILLSFLTDGCMFITVIAAVCTLYFLCCPSRERNDYGRPPEKKITKTQSAAE